MFESWPEMWGGGYPAYRTTLRKFLWFRTVTGGNAPEFKTVTGKIVSFLTRRIAPLKIEATLEPIQSGTGDPSPDNVRPISGHSGADIYVEDEYDAQADPTVQITFGSTVYGGTLTVNEDGTGSVVSEWESKIIHGSNIANVSSATGYATAKLGDIDYIVNGEGMCNVLAKHNGPASSMRNGYFNCITSTAYNRALLIFKLDFSSSTATEQKQKYAGWIDELEANGGELQVVYKLTTPVTIQLSPGQVNALLGNNTVWVDDSDNISVTYQSN